jgi:hypothetical protein
MLIFETTITRIVGVVLLFTFISPECSRSRSRRSSKPTTGTSREPRKRKRQDGNGNGREHDRPRGFQKLRELPVIGRAATGASAPPPRRARPRGPARASPA